MKRYAVANVRGSIQAVTVEDDDGLVGSAVLLNEAGDPLQRKEVRWVDGSPEVLDMVQASGYDLIDTPRWDAYRKATMAERMANAGSVGGGVVTEKRKLSNWVNASQPRPKAKGMRWVTSPEGDRERVGPDEVVARIAAGWSLGLKRKARRTKEETTVE